MLRARGSGREERVIRVGMGVDLFGLGASLSSRGRTNDLVQLLKVIRAMRLIRAIRAIRAIRPKIG